MKRQKTSFRSFLGASPLPVGLLHNPTFTKYGTWSHTALHGIPARSVRGLCRTERAHLPHSLASGTSTRPVIIELGVIATVFSPESYLSRTK